MKDNGIDICSSVQAEGVAKRSRSCFVLEILLSEFVPAIQSLLVVVITLPLATISARAAELAPMVGLEKNFRTGASALIYYTEGVDGDHVVTTVQSDDTKSMKIFRFISILAWDRLLKSQCRMSLVRQPIPL